MRSQSFFNLIYFIILFKQWKKEFNLVSAKVIFKTTAGSHENIADVSVESFDKADVGDN